MRGTLWSRAGIYRRFNKKSGQNVKFCPESVSKKFDTLLKNASIFSRGCSPLRA